MHCLRAQEFCMVRHPLHSLYPQETQWCIGLSVTTPPQAPKLLSWTNSSGVPIPALLVTSSISALCFATSFIGSGELWGWLQNIVGVSNQVLYSVELLDRETDLFCQIAWLSIGLSSWRFRQAWVRQGRPLDELKFRASWTWPWGPPFVVSFSRTNYSYLNSVIQVVSVSLLVLSAQIPSLFS
jgi:amino acid permease